MNKHVNCTSLKFWRSQEVPSRHLRDLRTSVGKELQLARLNCNLDLDYIAFKLSTSVKRLQQVENGKMGTLNVDEIIRIARLYNKKTKINLED